MHARNSQTTFLALTAAALIALTGCSASAGSPEEPAAPAAPAGESVDMVNGWVKAADSGMSAAFGDLENTGASDVTVVSVDTKASSALELHETVENETGEMIMREKTDGFTIPAGESLSLEPGGNHIMLMDLTNPIQAGDEITFTLTFSDDSTSEFSVPAKDYAGANENYEGGEEMDMDGMDMGGDMNMDEGTDMGGHSE